MRGRLRLALRLLGALGPTRPLLGLGRPAACPLAVAIRERLGDAVAMGVAVGDRRLLLYVPQLGRALCIVDET